MKEYTFIFWLKGTREEADTAADRAHAAGLTDVEWVYKGGRLSAEFKKVGASFAEVAADAKQRLLDLGVPLDSEAINVTAGEEDPRWRD